MRLLHYLKLHIQILLKAKQLLLSSRCLFEDADNRVQWQYQDQGFSNPSSKYLSIYIFRRDYPLAFVVKDCACKLFIPKGTLRNCTILTFPLVYEISNERNMYHCWYRGHRSNDYSTKAANTNVAKIAFSIALYNRSPRGNYEVMIAKGGISKIAKDRSTAIASPTPSPPATPPPPHPEG